MFTERDPKVNFWQYLRNGHYCSHPSNVFIDTHFLIGCSWVANGVPPGAVRPEYESWEEWFAVINPSEFVWQGLKTPGDDLIPGDTQWSDTDNFNRGIQPDSAVFRSYQKLKIIRIFPLFQETDGHMDMSISNFLRTNNINNWIITHENVTVICDESITEPFTGDPAVTTVPDESHEEAFVSLKIMVRLSPWELELYLPLEVVTLQVSVTHFSA